MNQLVQRIGTLEKKYKYAFFSAVILGIFAHTYKFTNTLLNFDALSAFYSSQNVVGSGRWLLSIACAPSSFFDLPWLVGVLSIFWIGVTAVLVVRIMSIQSAVMSVLTGALLVTFPAITETFFFEYTADGYMLAMAMAALAVYLTLPTRKLYGSLVAAVLIAMTCGIYQAYVSFALVLSLCTFILYLLEGKTTKKDNLLWIAGQAITYAVGFVLYYVVWKICLRVQHFEVTSYLGIDKAGIMSPSQYIVAFHKTIADFANFFLNHYFEGGRSLSFWIVLGIVFCLVAVVACAIAVVRSKILKNKGNFVLLLLCAVAIPFAIFMWSWVTEKIGYSYRMEQSICVLYIFVGVLSEKWTRPKVCNVVALVLSLFIFNNTVVANILYFRMNQINESSFSIATEMVTRIHLEDDGTAKYICVVGHLRPRDNFYIDPDDLGSFSGFSNDFFLNEETTVLYLRNVLHFNLQYYMDNLDVPVPEYPTSGTIGSKKVKFCAPGLEEESRKELILSEEVQNMPYWPAADSVRKIGDTIVVKMSDEHFDVDN